MSQYFMFQDTKNCIGCQSCQVACKSSKSLPVGPKPNLIVPIEPKMVDGVPRGAFIFMTCFHCEKPWCVGACPTGAMQKRTEDGIVFVNPVLCVGCKSCMSACPWGAPQWDAETKKVVKCDYCKDRLDQGLKPACVTICTSQCLKFDKANQVPDNRRERYAMAIANV
ncbi:MAG: 4Fe-4S dicluster domain-containing protein [Desulfobacterales bacterium]|jgi:Fe-S-cluster-containing dehydrogenase component